MRILIVSDIHSNIVALDAVLAAAREEAPIDEVWSLGDIVDYGPSPMECLDRLWELGALSIKGNHDAAVVGEIDLSDFNPIAAQAARWTMDQLTEEAKSYLGGLPTTTMESEFTLVHGSPKDPLWDYLMGYPQAVEAWERVETSDVLVGHSHFQFSCEAGRGLEQPSAEGMIVPLGPARVVINPGSVGQPRDGDPRAAYAIFDDEARHVHLQRTWYDVSATQRAMADVGLPEPLISRLSAGR